MKFTLIICTYLRPDPLLDLLRSVQNQTVYPDEIVIVDGSDNYKTQEALERHTFKNLHYFLVSDKDRGLTRQRNFGIHHSDPQSDFIAFLDDDTILMPDYFEHLKNTFEKNPDVTGVGGIAINENRWILQQSGVTYNPKKFYCFEGYVYKESQRNRLRNYFGLESDLGPGMMPEFSHGRTCGFPLTGKTYDADLLIGLSFAFRRKVFENIRFSGYFEGYGLYEDADFCIRALKYGRNVINTNVQLDHFHNPSGRPNHYRYGKMVVRNGWYVWRVKNPDPSLKIRIKWNLITLLLSVIRMSNILSTNDRKAAFKESMGRFSGWITLLFNKPQIDDDKN